MSSLASFRKHDEGSGARLAVSLRSQLIENHEQRLCEQRLAEK